MAVKRAARCPVPAYGWLYLEPTEERLLNGGPPKAHPDPKQSGTNPEYTAWGIEQIRQFAHQPYYRRQFQRRLEEVEKERELAFRSVSAQQADLDRLTALADELNAYLQLPA